MGTRYRTQSGKLETLDDVNLALRDIGLAEKELEMIDTAAHRQIADIKTQAAKDGEKLREKIASLAQKIQAFAEYNKDDFFKDRKSMELSFGQFGYRKSTKISVKKTTIGLMKMLHLDSFIRIKEEVDKEALRDLDDETLSQIDAVRKVSDDFFCEAKSEDVNKELLK